MQEDFLIFRKHNPGRRNFIRTGLQSIGVTSLLAIPGLGFTKETGVQETAYTVEEIIQLIIKDIPGAPFPKTVDTIKYGNPKSIVKGIVTTMFPTVEVIQQAILGNANLIIAHEPTYYNGQDNTNWVSDNSIVKKKQELLEKHQIVIWRFHDYCHSMVPDMVGYGILKKMNWLNYFTLVKQR